MEKIYFTIAGTKHHYGHEYFEPKMEVKLIKEPDNEFDGDAIAVYANDEKVGYVANFDTSESVVKATLKAYDEDMADGIESGLRRLTDKNGTKVTV